jgi:hypothetical protein
MLNISKVANQQLFPSLGFSSLNNMPREEEAHALKKKPVFFFLLNLVSMYNSCPFFFSV